MNHLKQQQIADIINGVIIEEKRKNTTTNTLGKTRERNAYSRRAAMYALQRFEAAGWYPKAFDQAIAERKNVDFNLATGEIKASLKDIREILERYIDIVEEATVAPAIENEMFSASRASFYISHQLARRGITISFSGINKHLFVYKDLRGTWIGNSMVFTRKQLDQYVKDFDKLPKRGRRGTREIES